MSDSTQRDSERLIAHTETLEQANKIRCYLLHHKPIPGVYVYLSNWQSEEGGYDVMVSTPWGGYLSDDAYQSLLTHLAQKKFEGEIDSLNKKTTSSKIKN